ncbi:hypothetical protein GGI21_002222 [Coemansia aciculifera]|nr:hypothetical protein GGI21_002222 [Coemansia aciculifera]
MEPSNFYVYHQGNGIITPKQKYLFVFPSSETPTKDVIGRFAASLFKKTNKRSRVELPVYWGTYFNNSLRKRFEEKSKEEQNTGGRVILTSHRNISERYGSDTFLYLRSQDRIDNQSMPLDDFILLKSNMDKLIEIHETTTADTPASKIDKALEGKGIYVYNARKLGHPYIFDKRSDEGKAFIEAKAAAKQEKQATKRFHNDNDKRRILDIEASRVDWQEA